MKIVRLLPVTALVAACVSGDAPNATLPLAPSLAVSGAASGGQLYTMSNATAGNEVIAFTRAADGALSAAGSYSTGGTGTGGGLGNQGALVIASRGRILLTVNAGSDQLSSFVIRGNGTLELVSTVWSGGTMPVSVTADGSTVYALNAGGTGNISGFTLSALGVLAPIAGSTLPLSGSAAGAAQISFAPNGRHLVVTEKATNKLSIYRLQSNGTATGPAVVSSNGATPFGFAFRGAVLVVSEAFGGAADASAASSYELRPNGTLITITASEPTLETAACWIAFSRNGRFAYTTNTGSGTITGYLVSSGQLSRLNADGITANVGAGTAPLDLAVSPDGRFIYSLNSGDESVSGWAINGDGSLAAIGGGVSGLIDGANGLVAR